MHKGKLVNMVTRSGFVVNRLKLTVVMTLLATSGLSVLSPPALGGTPILGVAQASISQAQAWARANKASQLFVDLAPLYWRLAPVRGGVRPEVAYAQAALETGWMHFKSGAVAREFHNPCGLKTALGGGDGDPDAHQRFTSWEAGVTACLDHLALYAGAQGYPKPPGTTPDPRHCQCLAGVASDVEALGGKWAPNPGYGERIVSGLLNPLLSTQVPPEPQHAGDPSDGERSIPTPILEVPQEAESVAAIRLAASRLAGLGIATAVESY